MNFLSHHWVARDAGPTEPPEFFVGNVLPDLIATAGERRIRPTQVAGADLPLPRGMSLHFETDRRFHALPEFAAARDLVKAIFADREFSEPPRRVFFLTHAFVEIALDALVLNADPGIAADFYRKFEQSDLPAVLAEVQAMHARDFLSLELAHTIDRFVESRYLLRYALPDGQAEALHRLCRRAGLPGFPVPSDRDKLADCFDFFGTRWSASARCILTLSLPPPPVVQ